MVGTRFATLLFEMDAIPHKWYARPVFYVTDIRRAIEFYVEKLGFTKKWHEAEGKGTVCQVDRSECEIILCEDSKRTDRGRLFVELTPAGRRELREEIAARDVPTDMTWWGYDCIRDKDPDGNELLFPLEE